MNHDIFASRVKENLGGNAAFLDDLLAFIKELLPIIIPLFGNCPAGMVQRSAARKRGLLFRVKHRRVKETIAERIGDDSAAYELTNALVKAAANSTEAELSQLLAA